MSNIRIKRGASLSLTLGFGNEDGSPFALSGVTLTAQVRDAEFNLVATLTPEPIATAGQASIFVQDTSAWPEGLLRMDVRVLPASGPQTLSETFGIFVERAVTQTTPEQAPYDPVTGT